MSRSSDLALHLAEERAWATHMDEQAEKAYITAYTKGILPHQIKRDDTNDQDQQANERNGQHEVQQR